MASQNERELDIVLFGATGFVGRLTAAHLAQHAPDGIRIALAGRSPERLAAVREQLGPRAAEWPLLVVDAFDADAVGELAARTRVVCTTVGPYATYGAPLVAACARAGTHYCDLTGEVLFVRESIDANHAEAERTGARIVHACGFDSIPSDLGVLVTAQAAAAAGDGTLTDTRLHVRSLRGGLSGGTIDSARQQAIAMGQDKTLREIAADPYGLSPDRANEPTRRGIQGDAGQAGSGLKAVLDDVLAKATKALPATHDEVTGQWYAPFFMASFNTRIVRRSNALSDWSYGREFRYDEVMDTGAGPSGAVRAGATTVALGAIFGGLSFGPTRAVLDRVLPAPGEGPSEESQARGRFVMNIEAGTSGGARYRTRVSAPYDPGYSGTAIMLGQSALSLALDAANLPERAGVLTPATALGEALVERLRSFDFVFDPERLT